MVLINKKHTPSTWRRITLERGVPTMSLDDFEFSLFDSTREASNELNTFELEIYQETETSWVFLRTYMLTSSNLRRFH